MMRQVSSRERPSHFHGKRVVRYAKRPTDLIRWKQSVPQTPSTAEQRIQVIPMEAFHQDPDFSFGSGLRSMLHFKRIPGGNFVVGYRCDRFDLGGNIWGNALRRGTASPCKSFVFGKIDSPLGRIPRLRSIARLLPVPDFESMRTVLVPGRLDRSRARHGCSAVNAPADWAAALFASDSGMRLDSLPWPIGLPARICYPL